MAAQRVTRGIIAAGMVWALTATLLAVASPEGEAATRKFVGGWIPYWSTQANLQNFRSNADLFADISPFWHSLTGDASVSDQESPGDRSAVIGAARDAGVPVVPAITDGMGKGRLAAALADPVRRATIVQTMVQLVQSRGYDGLDLDLEGFAYTDGRSTWSATRPAWVVFVTKLGAELHARGKVLYATIPPTYNSDRASNSGYWVYDYAAIAPHVDRVRLMAYDFSVGRAGAIAPYDWVDRLVSYAVTQIPSRKVVLGIPAYGRDWVTGISGTCPDGASTSRRSLTTAAAWDLAEREGATARWDPVTRERTFTYSEDFQQGGASCTVTRVVHFSDASAIAERTQLAQRHQLGGVALWTVGGADAATWRSLRAVSDGKGRPLAAGQVLEVPVAGGSSGVPGDAEAVALNITVTEPDRAGFLRAYPCGSAMPSTSTVNFTAGQTIASSATVGVGAGGKVCVYSTATAHLVIDDAGYFPAGSAFAASSPQRMLDTRQTAGKPTAGSDTVVRLPAGAAAGALMIAVTEPEAAGWVGAYPCGTRFPGTATVNYTAGQTIANAAIVKAGSDRKVCIRTLTKTHIVVDLMGTIDAGQGFRAGAPQRLADTRVSPGRPLAPTTEFTVAADPAAPAVVINLTATGSRDAGWIQAYPCGSKPALTSNLNHAAGQTISNGAIVKTTGAKLCLRTLNPTHLVVDQTAALPSDTFRPATPRRITDTRIP